MAKIYSQSYSARYMRVYRADHPEYVKKDYENRIRYRLELMDILGGKKCKQCGFTDNRALHIDHIKGGGCREYKPQHGYNSMRMYVFYVKHPEQAKKKLQVLCANCNSIKRYTNGELNHFG